MFVKPFAIEAVGARSCFSFTLNTLLYFTAHPLDGSLTSTLKSSYVVELLSTNRLINLTSFTPSATIAYASPDNGLSTVSYPARFTSLNNVYVNPSTAFGTYRANDSSIQTS